MFEKKIRVQKEGQGSLPERLAESLGSSAGAKMIYGEPVLNDGVVLGVTVLHGLGGTSFAADGRGFGKAKNVIFLQMIGGMTHIDTLDPKEGATQGPVKPISTKAGFQLGGTMENLAKHADKISIIRSMTSKTGVHASGQYLIRTGYEQRGPIQHPNIGAWAQNFLGASHKTPCLPACA